MLDGSLVTYEYHGNMVRLLKWLEENPPQDIDNPSHINQNELRDKRSENIVEIVSESDVKTGGEVQGLGPSQGLSRSGIL